MAQSPNTQSVFKVIFIVIVSVMFIGLLWLLREPLTWIFLAAFIAAALSGPVNYLHRFMKRGFAITLVMLGLILVPIGLGLIVIPPVVNGAVDLVNKAPEYADQVQEYVAKNEKLSDLEEKYHISEKLEEKADELPSAVGNAAGVLADFGSGLISSVAALATILVMAVFMLGGASRWVEWLIRQQPRKHQPRLQRVLSKSNQAIGNYLAGNIAISFVAAVTGYVVMLILDVPYAAPLAVVIGVLDLIPMIGSLLAGVIVGIVTLFVDFPTVTIIWAVWMIVYQQIENNVIQPQVQKRSVDINPLVVIIAVLFGSTLFGIIGALLAIPLAATIQIILREWWDYRQPTRRRQVAR